MMNFTRITEGPFKKSLELPLSWRNYVSKQDWDSLYEACLSALKDGQCLSNVLKSLTLESFQTETFDYEIMLALRTGPQDEEEEGIWHDDGSRDFALSISLNPEPHTIDGGEVYVRQKQAPEVVSSLENLPWGHFWVFPTGKYGWDHRTSRVNSGNRLVLVIWVTLKS